MGILRMLAGLVAAIGMTGAWIHVAKGDAAPSHVRAALLKPSLTIPFKDGRLLLGTWQQIVVIDFDTRARRRDVIFQFSGE